MQHRVLPKLFSRGSRRNSSRLAGKRQRGGIEPLHVSMPRGLKPRPSTSPTHPGSLKRRVHPNAPAMPNAKSNNTGVLRCIEQHIIDASCYELASGPCRISSAIPGNQKCQRGRVGRNPHITRRRICLIRFEQRSMSRPALNEVAQGRQSESGTVRSNTHHRTCSVARMTSARACGAEDRIVHYDFTTRSRGDACVLSA